MGWQTLAAYGAAAVVVIAIVLIAFRMLRREALDRGEDREAKENMEEVLNLDRVGHESDPEPIPIGLTEQLRRLRNLLSKTKAGGSK